MARSFGRPYNARMRGTWLLLCCLCLATTGRAEPIDETALPLPEDLGRGLHRSVTSLRKGSQVSTECYKDMYTTRHESLRWQGDRVKVLLDPSGLKVGEKRRAK